MVKRKRFLHKVLAVVLMLAARGATHGGELPEVIGIKWVDGNGETTIIKEVDTLHQWRQKRPRVRLPLPTSAKTGSIWHEISKFIWYFTRFALPLQPK